MKRAVIFKCAECGADHCGELGDVDTHVSCESCHQSTDIKPFLDTYEQCPFCECKAFYVQKSIRPKLMWGGLFVAIVFVPKTYGLSLPVLWLIDLAIHRKIPDLLVCYRCRASFQGFSIPERFKAFQHWIGDKHDS